MLSGQATCLDAQCESPLDQGCPEFMECHRLDLTNPFLGQSHRSAHLFQRRGASVIAPPKAQLEDCLFPVGEEGMVMPEELIDGE